MSEEGAAEELAVENQPENLPETPPDMPVEAPVEPERPEPCVGCSSWRNGLCLVYDNFRAANGPDAVLEQCGLRVPEGDSE